MKVTQTSIPDVLVIEPRVFRDNRGFFFESYNQREFERTVGHSVQFLQDSQSRSKCSVLRGLHYQVKRPQGKLVRVIAGEVFDVAVDLREKSLTFGQWIGEYLSADNKKQLWVPEGFAHGFLVVSESAEFLYKSTDYWMPEYERCIKWNDSLLNITWPLGGRMPIVSAKDAAGRPFDQAEYFGIAQSRTT